MSKTKIPIWEHALDFPEELEDLGLMLLRVSDRNYQVRIWAKADGPEVEWFNEAYFSVELQTEYFKKDIRRCDIKPSKEQIKAVLRILIMFRRLDKSFKFKTFPKDHYEHEMAIIDDPYFDKIRRHAAYAASLFRLPEPRLPEPRKD